jgi:hypothetical protein
MQLMTFKAQDDKGGRAGTYTVLLAKVGRKYIHVIFMDSGGIRLQRMNIRELDYMTELVDYPIKRAVNKFKRAGRKFGITRSAKIALKEST